LALLSSARTKSKMTGPSLPRPRQLFPRHPLHDAVEHAARFAEGRVAFTEAEHALVVLSALVWVAAIALALRCASPQTAPLQVLAAALFPRLYVAYAAVRTWVAPGAVLGCRAARGAPR
jgi:Flp pilus assembly protein TadB